MPVQSPFEGAKEYAEGEKKALLEAVAQQGAAGKAAWQTAQAETDKMRQAALDRAQQRARLTGQELGGTDVAPVAETADRFGTYFAGQQAAGQDLFGQIGASGESYLSKIAAISPFMKEKGDIAAAEREQKYRLGIAANQAKLDAEKEAAAEAHKRDIELLKLRASIDETAAEKAATRAAIAKAAEKAAEPLGKADILGAGQTIADQYSQMLNKPDAFSAEQAGRALAAYKGIPDVTVNTLLGPRTPSPAASSLAPLPPIDKNWLTSAFRYDGKPISSKRADEVLNAPEIKTAQELIPQIASLKRDPISGRVDEDLTWQGQKVSTKGMTPREIFNFWLDAAPGIRTMKEALRERYGSYLDTIGKR